MSARTAELILKLVDDVTRPAREMAGSLRGLNRVLEGLNAPHMASFVRSMAQAERSVARMSNSVRAMGRNLGIATNVAATVGGAAFAKNIFDYQSARNFAFGRLLDENASMDFDGKQWNRERTQAWFDKLVADTDASLPLNADQIASAVAEGAGAGLSAAQIDGSLKEAMQFAVAARMQPDEAMLGLTSIAQMFRLNLDGVEASAKTIAMLSDKVSYGANQSAQSAQELYEALKYAGPLASAIGLTPDEVIGQTMTLANSGIRGSEAGVTLRQTYSSLIKPTKQSAATLESYGIDLGDYTTGAIDANAVISQLQAGGMQAQNLAAPIAKILGDTSLKLTEQVSEIAGLAADASGSAANAAAASDAVFEAFTSSGRLDVNGIIAALDAAKVKPADWIRIFTLRGGAKTLSLLNDDAREKAADVEANAAGTSARIAQEQMRDLPGAIDRLTSAFGRLAQAVGDSALMQGIIGGMDAATSVLSWLATLPDPLLSIAAAAGALAALGGSLAVLEALSGVGGLLGAAAGLAAVAVKALGPIGVAVAAVQAAMWGFDALDKMRMKALDEAEAEEKTPDYLKEQLAKIDSDIALIKANPDAQFPHAENYGPVEQLSAEQMLTIKLEERAKVEAQIAETLADGVAAGIPAATANMQQLMDAITAIGASGVSVPVDLVPSGLPGVVQGEAGANAPAPSIEGARATGGPLWNGWFLAGEKGPELGYASGKGHMFNASETKRILSGGDAGGAAQNITMHFNVTNADPAGFVRQVSRLLDSQLQRSRGLSMEDRPAHG